MQPLDGPEHAVGRQCGVGATEQRPHRPQRPPVRREHLLDVPRQNLGQRQQPERLAGRRTVHDDEVEPPGLDLRAQLEQGQHLVGARQDDQLLGLQCVDPRAGKQPPQVGLDVVPAALERGLGVDLHGVQPGVHLARLTGQRHPECVGERVRRVGREHQCLDTP